MFATEILRKEHDAILKMLDATDEVRQRLIRGEVVPSSTLDGLLEFFRLFADRCHHGKEEDLLFPLLEKKGMARDCGPIGVMLHEHDRGRELVREMELASSPAQDIAGPSGRRWAQAAAQYTNLLREHIEKENNVLFQMAENLLTPEEQERLAREFERIEFEKMGAGTHERLHARMEQLLREITKSRAAIE
ncbi:MAG: hemerythrin domain-containing protein [Candidatus Acidiferrales bacterium]